MAVTSAVAPEVVVDIADVSDGSDLPPRRVGRAAHAVGTKVSAGVLLLRTWALHEAMSHQLPYARRKAVRGGVARVRSGHGVAARSSHARVVPTSGEGTRHVDHRSVVDRRRSAVSAPSPSFLRPASAARTTPRVFRGSALRYLSRASPDPEDARAHARDVVTPRHTDSLAGLRRGPMPAFEHQCRQSRSRLRNAPVPVGSYSLEPCLRLRNVTARQSARNHASPSRSPLRNVTESLSAVHRTLDATGVARKIAHVMSE